MRILDTYPHHLVATTDADHPFASLVGLDDGFRNAVGPQTLQVSQGVFRTGQQDDVSPFHLADVVGIVSIEARIHRQHVEIGKVGHVLQENDGHIDLAGTIPVAFHVEDDRILLFDLDVPEIGNHTDYGQSGQLFQQLASLGKQGDVAPELVDDDPLHLLTLFRCEEGDRAIHRTEHATPVDVGHQVGSCIHGHSHAHVGDVAVAQVEFGDAAGPFEHNRTVTRLQPVEGCLCLDEQFLFLQLLPEVVLCGQIAYGLSVEHDLRVFVASRFQEHGVHVGMRRNTASLGLYHLCPSHLASIGRGEGIERHVLGLKRGRMIAVLSENATKCCIYDAFSGI